MKRKDFIHTTLLGAGTALALPAIAGSGKFQEFLISKLDKVGIQLFSCPKLMESDPAKALQMLASMGYSEIELYGPYPFSSESYKQRWASLSPMLGFSGSGYFEQDRKDFKILSNELGLGIPSLHTDLDTLENRMPALARDARYLGASHVTLPAIPDALRQTLDDYKRIAERFNQIGASARDLGLRFAYHNHGYGLQVIDGTVPFELLMDQTDPDLVFLEMDIFWTTAGRADPLDYLQKYAGRYRMIHLKDMKKLEYFSGDGGDATQWMALFPNMATAGTGVLDLEAIVETALQTGVKHFFVEQDMVAQPEIALLESFTYLNNL